MAELFGVVFNGQADTGNVVSPNPLGTTGLSVANGTWSITSGLLTNAATSGEEWIWKASVDAATMYYECDVMPIAGATTYFRCIIYVNFNAADTSKKIGVAINPGTFQCYGPGASGTNIATITTIPTTGWILRLEKTSDATNIYVTAKLFDKVGYVAATSTPLYTANPITVAKSSAVVSNPGIGYSCRTGGTTTNRSRATYITVSDSLTDPLVGPSISVVMTESQATISGSPSGGTTPYLMQLYSSSVFQDSSNPGTLVGEYTSGMVIGGLSENSCRYYIVKVTDSDSSVVWSNCIIAETYRSKSLKIGIIGTSTLTVTGADGESVVVKMERILKDSIGGISDVSVVNGSVAGYSSGQFVPGQAAYNNLVSAFNSAGVTVVIMMLGANDYGNSIPVTGANSTKYCWDLIIAGLSTDIVGIKKIIMQELRWPNGYYPTSNGYQLRDLSRSYSGQSVNGIRIIAGDESVMSISEARGAGYYAAAYGETGASHPSSPSGIESLAAQLATMVLSDLYGGVKSLLMLHVG